MSNFQPKDYWETRLRASLNLEGVGCAGRGMQYNDAIYRAKRRTMDRGLRQAGLQDCSGRSVLDLGAGTGFWINYFLQKNVQECVGVDITEVAVQHLREVFPPERTAFFCANMADPDLPSQLDRRFDITTAIDVMYHIVDDDLAARAVHNINQALKPGGWFIFTDVPYALKPSPQEHVRWRPIHQWQSLLAECDLNIRLQIPMYILLHPGLCGPSVIRKVVNGFHYKLTPLLSEKGAVGRLYLRALNALDSAGTRLGGTSQFLILAQKSQV